VLGRYAEVARILTGRPDAAPEAAAAWVGDLAEALKIPGLAAHGLTPADIPAAVAQSREASSMRGNPIELADPELHRILEDAL
jgi:alcohol dehydrogenase class IV